MLNLTSTSALQKLMNRAASARAFNAAMHASVGSSTKNPTFLYQIKDSSHALFKP